MVVFTLLFVWDIKRNFTVDGERIMPIPKFLMQFWDAVCTRGTLSHYVKKKEYRFRGPLLESRSGIQAISQRYPLRRQSKLEEYWNPGSGIQAISLRLSEATPQVSIVPKMHPEGMEEPSGLAPTPADELPF